MSADSVIARRPPDDGQEWDAQCARCGSSVVHLGCPTCGGDGFVFDDDDPDWRQPGGDRCHDCDGAGGWQECGSGVEWCKAHPMVSREGVDPGAIEWFVTTRWS